jgi:hypothetical protein
VPHLRVDVLSADLSRYRLPRWLDFRRARSLDRVAHSGWNWAISVRGSSHVTWKSGRPLRRFHDEFRDWTERRRIPGQIGFRTPRKNACAAGITFPVFKPSPLVLQIPAGERDFARGRLGDRPGPVIAILVGSAEIQKSPELPFWHALIKRLLAEWPTAKIVLLGVLGTRRGRTANVGRSDVDALLSLDSSIIDAFDIGIVRQLALCERAQLLIAPHTGMAFAAQCVGTPWLALSGWKYYEYLTNGVPFHSLYPACPLYPCTESTIKAECRTIAAKRTGAVECMTAEALSERIPAILEQAAILIRGARPYRDCIASHRANLAARRPDGSLGIWENVSP